MSKHTPGPWVTCNTANVFTKLGSTNAEGIEAPSNDGWMIADCDMGSLSLEEVRANTLLIAAAPDLLEALKEFDDSFCDFDPANNESRSRMRLSLIKARAAIAKATGGSNA